VDGQKGVTAVIFSGEQGVQFQFVKPFLQPLRLPGHLFFKRLLALFLGEAAQLQEVGELFFQGAPCLQLLPLPGEPLYLLLGVGALPEIGLRNLCFQFGQFPFPCCQVKGRRGAA